MKRILVISWFYPPINSSEALVTYKLLRHSGYTYDVFTQQQSESWSFGRSAALPETDNVRCIYAESRELRSFEAEALRFFLRHRADYDIVMTRSMPPECHRVGLKIKERCPQIRWIASFGDPIRSNPYELIGGGSYSPWSMKNPLNRGRALRFRLSPLRLLRHFLWTARHLRALGQRRAMERIETETLKKADRLLFNNASQLRYMAGDGDLGERAVLLRHSFDPSLYPPQPTEKTKRRLRFVFLGQLNALRTPLPLLKAVERLREDLPDLPERAEFLFFGDMADADLAYILRRGLSDTVQVRRPVSYRQSLAESAAADWLVHIDGNISAVTEENVFFAGKLADYFGAGKPILAVTMPQGDTADCLRRAGALTLSFSVNEIKQALYQIIARGLSVRMDRGFLDEFSARRVAAALDERAVKPLL